ncbi:MAG: hypothetical protein NMK33_04045 [Candidatus Cardinium sp.]|uniref:hypothetical protein n=1 Tax=Cardinium endosymbiont of Dermatophagoides farinae TaxID=2597823 RepID=UPI001183FA90|nr:hypothetical protein [Cardinium endosymbiont of Dermatophagoides farinae]TSJ80610.1 hypothetical protein FPG78_00770 [Cardinium endosymbiont of Dermatophagoides farinae]UWW96603.1 MAG: hypothetical protein NMK33_04045 [Candidatus Cardinium sp.]
MHLFHYLGLLLFFCFFPLLACSDDSPPSMLPSSLSAKLLCKIRGESFIDNTEYFNKILEGETIFGFHFLPSLTLLIAKDMGLNLGLIWEKHFGHRKPWDGIKPALSIYYSAQKSSFIIGIFSLQDHALLEPLYLSRKPFIEGLYFKLANDKSYLSGWLNWLTLLSKKENQPETFTFHLDGAYYDSNNRIKYTIPFQLAIYHLGGQGISVKDYSLWSGASGLSLCFPGSFPIHGSSYLLFNSYVKEIERPFKKGWAQLHILDWQMAFLGVSLSYWYGHNFSSENIGHPLYQSIRIADHKVVHYEAIRSLLFLSIYKNWMPRPGITIQAVYRPYYDFKNRLLEYSFACKLVYTVTIGCPKRFQ